MGKSVRPVLFVCTLNAVRSVMAEAIFKNHTGVIAQSCGVMAGPPSGFTSVVLSEIGLDVSDHSAQDFADLRPEDFGIVITMSLEARNEIENWAAGRLVDKQLVHEHWNIGDPDGHYGSRETQLEGYRTVRDEIAGRVTGYFDGYFNPK